MESKMFKIDVKVGGKLYTNVDCLPFENGHVLAQIEKDAKECKRCTKCGKWHVIEDFYCSSQSKDGLQSWDKECFNLYCKQHRAKKVGKSAEDIPEQIEALEPTQESADKDLNDIVKEFVGELGEYFNGTLRTENEDWIEEAERLGRENQELKKRIEELTKKSLEPIDVSQLNLRLVEQYINENDVPLRILANGIKAISPKYDIVLIDTETGCTKTIKYEQGNEKAA